MVRASPTPSLAQRGGPSTLGVAMAWLHQGIKGAVFAEVALRPNQLTDAEDRTLARLRTLRPGLALS
jgi:hypothetical protein